jgi:hypothetical protein
MAPMRHLLLKKPRRCLPDNKIVSHDFMKRDCVAPMRKTKIPILAASSTDAVFYLSSIRTGRRSCND